MTLQNPELMKVSARGLDFAVWHWPGSGPRLLFIHGTGFHSRLWDQVIANLPGYDCWAFDMRGHGLSAKPPPPYLWRDFGTDTATLMREIDLNVDLGIGHSMGGHSVTLAAAREPKRFRALILIDPIITAAQHYGQVQSQEHPVLKRRNNWVSWECMFNRFKNRKPFVTWNQEVLKDYCYYGLLPDTTSDGYKLACPPTVEGSIYIHATDLNANIYTEIEQIEVAVLIIHPEASPDGKPQALMPVDLFRSFKHGRELFLPGHTHFIPMEVPQVVAEQIKSMVQNL